MSARSRIRIAGTKLILLVLIVAFEVCLNTDLLHLPPEIKSLLNPPSKYAYDKTDALKPEKSTSEILKSLHLDPEGPCQGKEHLVEILNATSQHPNITNSTCLRLPAWKQVTEIYGEDPIILGLDTCDRYRSLLSELNITKPMVRVAGLYNTGTNAFDQALDLNFEILEGHLRRHEVPWGKHVEVKYRVNNTKNTKQLDLVLPVVLVRDAYQWMQSMVSLPSL